MVGLVRVQAKASVNPFVENTACVSELCADSRFIHDPIVAIIRPPYQSIKEGFTFERLGKTRPISPLAPLHPNEGTRDLSHVADSQR